jgi:hypothetical protein
VLPWVISTPIVPGVLIVIKSDSVYFAWLPHQVIDNIRSSWNILRWHQFSEMLICPSVLRRVVPISKVYPIGIACRKTSHHITLVAAEWMYHNTLIGISGNSTFYCRTWVGAAQPDDRKND